MPHQSPRRTAAVITVSDACSQGSRQDISGPAVARELDAGGFETVLRITVPDEQPAIEDALRRAVGSARSVVTTGRHRNRQSRCNSRSDARRLRAADRRGSRADARRRQTRNAVGEFEPCPLRNPGRVADPEPAGKPFGRCRFPARRASGPGACARSARGEDGTWRGGCGFR